MIDVDLVVQHIMDYNENAQVIIIDINEFVFELKTRINCFYCGKYNASWRCPPRIPDIDYQRMFKEFNHALILYQSYIVTPDNQKEVRIESSLSIHRTLLDAEKFLYEHNCVTALSFIGGSCKLCKSGCGVDRCNNPYLARIPVEATGINIIKTLEKRGVNITFPTNSEMKRVGLLVWD